MTEPIAFAEEPEGLAQQLERIASRLREQGASEPGCDEGDILQQERVSRERYLDLARQIYRSRRERDSFFPSALFGEPAWDMLLDLYIAEIERRLVHVGSLCEAGGVPPTTGLRWIALLEEKGLIVRVRSKDDRRIVFLRLSSTSRRMMQDYLRRASGAVNVAPRLRAVK